MRRSWQSDSNKEFLWLFVVSAIILFLANTPYLIGYLNQTNDLIYAGIALAPEDGLSYLANMQQGFRGLWLYHSPYNAAYHEPKLLFTYYLLLGNMARWMGLPLTSIYHIARTVNGLFLLFVCYLTISDITEKIDHRRYIFLVLGFSSGLGWIMLPFGQFLSTDLTVPESNTFFSLIHAPHIILAESIIILIARDFLHLDRSKGDFFHRGFQICLLSLCLAFLQPNAIAIMFGMLGLFVLLDWIEKKELDKQKIFSILAACICVSPYMIYSWHSIQADPVLSGWLKQNICLSPSVVYYITGYGLLLPGVIIGFHKLNLNTNPMNKMLICWIIITLLGLYAPTQLQRRLVMGLHIPFSIIAGDGILKFLEARFPQKSWVLSRLYLLALIPTSIVLIGIYSGGSITQSPKVFLTKGELSAFEWMNSNFPTDHFVISSPELGSFVPAFTDQIAVYGHGHQTGNAKETKKEVEEFFSNQTDSEKRRDYLNQKSIDLIILGDRERAIGINALSEADGVIKVGEFGEVQVFSRITDDIYSQHQIYYQAH